MISISSTLLKTKEILLRFRYKANSENTKNKNTCEPMISFLAVFISNNTRERSTNDLKDILSVNLSVNSRQRMKTERTLGETSNEKQEKIQEKKKHIQSMSYALGVPKSTFLVR